MQSFGRTEAEAHLIVKERGPLRLKDSVAKATENHAPLAPVALTALDNWLGAAGVPWTRRGDIVGAQLTVGVARELLRTELNWVVHSATGQNAMRAAAVFLPGEVYDSVFAVYGLHCQPLPHLLPVAARPCQFSECHASRHPHSVATRRQRKLRPNWTWRTSWEWHPVCSSSSGTSAQWTSVGTWSNGPKSVVRVGCFRLQLPGDTKRSLRGEPSSNSNWFRPETCG